MVIYKTLKILSLIVLILLIGQLVFGARKLTPIISFLILYYSIFTLFLFAISKQLDKIKSIILYGVFLIPIILLIIILIYLFLFWEFNGF